MDTVGCIFVLKFNSHRTQNFPRCTIAPEDVPQGYIYLSVGN